MKKSILVFTALCFLSAPAIAEDGKIGRLDKKIAEIEQEYEEDVREIEAKYKLSDEMKRLRLEQKKQMKDLKIKQAKEIYEMKTLQKAERKALKHKERSQINEDTIPAEINKQRNDFQKEKSQKRKTLRKLLTD